MSYPLANSVLDTLILDGVITCQGPRIEKKVINGDITITDRRYNGYEKDTGYHHFTIDVAKDYEVEEE